MRWGGCVPGLPEAADVACDGAGGADIWVGGLVGGLGVGSRGGGWWGGIGLWGWAGGRGWDLGVFGYVVCPGPEKLRLLRAGGKWQAESH